MTRWIIRRLFKSWRPTITALAVSGVTLAGAATTIVAAPPVPGTGLKIADIGDDFEDPNWSWTLNLPKSSSNIDQQVRYPAAEATNGRWYESAFRGTPDIVKRVDTPPGGIAGSKGAMSMRTLQSGIPGYVSNKDQHDDPLMAGSSRMGGPISVAQNPSMVCRVWVPPFEQWEQRTGSSFGFRSDVKGYSWTNVGSNGKKRNFFTSGPQRKYESYWPGMFIQYVAKKDSPTGQAQASFIIRSDEMGRDIQGPQIPKHGWYTLGMSFTSDGQVHYFIKPGVENLTIKDHVGSYVPYGFQSEAVYTLFFNIVNQDDHRSWSTEWIVDDVYMYYNSR